MGGSFRATDTALQSVFVRDIDTGDPLIGLTDLVAKVANPDDSVLAPAIPLVAVADLPGVYEFPVLPAQRTQVGLHLWQVTSPTANMDAPLTGGFLSGIL